MSLATRSRTLVALVALAVTSVLAAPSVPAGASAIKTIRLGGAILTAATDSKSLWVTASASKTIDRFDLVSGRLIRQFPFDTSVAAMTTYGTRIRASYSDGQQLFVGGPGLIDVINETTGKSIAHVALPGEVFAMTASATTLFVLEWNAYRSASEKYDFAYQSISLTTHRLLNTLWVKPPAGQCGETNVAITYAGGFVWASPECFSPLLQIDPATMHLVKSWKLAKGQSPYPATNGTTLYLGDQEVDTSLYAISLSTLAEHAISVGTLYVGTVAADGDKVWTDLIPKSPSASGAGIYVLSASGTTSPKLELPLKQGVNLVGLFTGNGHCWAITDVAGAAVTSSSILELY